MEEPPFVKDRPVTRAALEWATAQHGDQLREMDCAPFILHPMEVAALLSGRDHDDEVIAAGLLHDVVEDTEAGLAEIEERFGPRVAGIVAACTEDPAIEDYAERKAALREQVRLAGRDAQAVFAADKIVKARELRAQAAAAQEHLDDPALRRRLDHYAASVEVLSGVEPAPPLLRQLAFEVWALVHLPPQRPRTRDDGPC